MPDLEGIRKIAPTIPDKTAGIWGTDAIDILLAEIARAEDALAEMTYQRDSESAWANRYHADWVEAEGKLAAMTEDRDTMIGKAAEFQSERNGLRTRLENCEKHLAAVTAERDALAAQVGGGKAIVEQAMSEVFPREEIDILALQAILAAPPTAAVERVRKLEELLIATRAWVELGKWIDYKRMEAAVADLVEYTGRSICEGGRDPCSPYPVT